MAQISVPFDENVLVGISGSDDAGVYRISEDTALVQTLDFITPIVDDPRTFGMIVATNALSDVYAMGGRPLTALNIVGFPLDTFSLDILGSILKGGIEVLDRAGVRLLGGHSVEDRELKYGLSITGIIDPGRIIRNTGLEAGDRIILTKPLGTGILGTAVKAGVLEDEFYEPFVKAMTTLNRTASEIMMNYDVHACTDVTGFGLAGHMREMIGDNNLEVRIDSGAVPVLAGVQDKSEMGFNPGGLFRNRDFLGSAFSAAEGTAPFLSDLVFDPQTSGGLLIAVDNDSAGDLVRDLQESGANEARIVATVTSSEFPLIKLV